MRFSVFTHAEHYIYKDRIYSYGPYVNEMNYWISRFNEIRIIAPVAQKAPGSIDAYYKHENIKIEPVPALHYKKESLFQSLAQSFKVMKACFKEMKKADHIHLRCPGNIGALAMVVSSFYPKKPKTVKYAGNWDPESNQPLSYRFQKWWLSNTFLTRNVKVLVYGNWPGQNRNIVPFFTASFSETEKGLIVKKFKAPFKFIFCGSLVEGKNPLLAVKIIHKLSLEGFDVSLDIYGDGPEKNTIIKYIKKHNLYDIIALHGNQPQEVLKEAYKKAYFSVLPSKSEGWPKALAEGMFFGCIPIGTEVSCVPWMLAQGRRGVLLPPKGGSQEASEIIAPILKDEEEMKRMSCRAQEWSQEYTLEKFRVEIHKLL